MKTWRDISSVPVPENIAALPKDARGYPIPWSVVIDKNGKPDFRIIDTQKAAVSIDERRCAICGKHIGQYAAFVGGPKSMNSRMFVDGPMHPDCAEYAVHVCPFIAAPKFSYISQYKEHSGFDIKVISEISDDRPDVFGIGVTDQYVVGLLRDSIVIVASMWSSPIRWFRHGNELRTLREGGTHEA